MLVLSTARLCSLNLSLGRRLVSPVYIVWMQITGETAFRQPSVPFPWSVAVHHQSLAWPREKRSSWGGGCPRLILNNYSSSPNGLWVNGRDPFNQNSNRSDREKRTTSKGGPIFSKLFRLDRTDPLSLDRNFRKVWLNGSRPIAHEAEGRMDYWFRGHEGERNNCFSKIQLVGPKYRE